MEKSMETVEQLAQAKDTKALSLIEYNWPTLFVHVPSCRFFMVVGKHLKTWCKDKAEGHKFLEMVALENLSSVVGLVYEVETETAFNFLPPESSSMHWAAKRYKRQQDTELVIGIVLVIAVMSLLLLARVGAGY